MLKLRVLDATLRMRQSDLSPLPLLWQDVDGAYQALATGDTAWRTRADHALITDLRKTTATRMAQGIDERVRTVLTSALSHYHADYGSYPVLPEGTLKALVTSLGSYLPSETIAPWLYTEVFYDWYGLAWYSSSTGQYELVDHVDFRSLSKGSGEGPGRRGSHE